MDKRLRVCLFVLVVGVSLLAVSVVRTESLPRYLIFGNEEEGETSGWVLYSEFLMFSRDFRVDIRANDTVSVYILDEVAVEQWCSDGSVDAMWAYEGILGGVFIEHSDVRGGCAVLVYLPEDKATAVKVTLNFSGVEKDLLTFSLAIIGVGGLSLIILLIFIMRKKRRKLLYQKSLYA